MHAGGAREHSDGAAWLGSRNAQHVLAAPRAVSTLLLRPQDYFAFDEASGSISPCAASQQRGGMLVCSQLSEVADGGTAFCRAAGACGWQHGYGGSDLLRLLRLLASLAHSLCLPLSLTHTLPLFAGLGAHLPCRLHASVRRRALLRRRGRARGRVCGGARAPTARQQPRSSRQGKQQQPQQQLAAMVAQAPPQAAAAGGGADAARRGAVSGDGAGRRGAAAARHGAGAAEGASSSTGQRAGGAGQGGGGAQQTRQRRVTNRVSQHPRLVPASTARQNFQLLIHWQSYLLASSLSA